MEEGRPFLGRDASSLIVDNSTAPLRATSERVAASVENSKHKTIAILDEQPAEVFRHLYLRERPTRFKAAPEGNEQPILIGHRFLALCPCID